MSCEEKVFTLLGKSVLPLTATLNDTHAFWNHLLWAKKAHFNSRKPEDASFIKLRAVAFHSDVKPGKNTAAPLAVAQGEVLEASFDNDFAGSVRAERQEDGSYLFGFQGQSDRAVFDEESMTLRFDSGRVWVPLFQDALCFSKPRVEPELPLVSPSPLSTVSRQTDELFAGQIQRRSQSKKGSKVNSDALNTVGPRRTFSTMNPLPPISSLPLPTPNAVVANPSSSSQTFTSFPAPPIPLAQNVVFWVGVIGLIGCLILLFWKARCLKNDKVLF